MSNLEKFLTGLAVLSAILMVALDMTSNNYLFKIESELKAIKGILSEMEGYE